VHITLNAALESEGNGGLSNNTRATAQNLDPSFLSLGGAATRGAVVGITDSPSTADFYSFTLAGGDTVSLALTLPLGAPTLTLQNASGATLALGAVDATNVSSVITDFTAPAAGTYYAMVSGAGGQTYTLLATRNAEFDTEPNDSPLNAQDVLSRQVAGQQRLLGYVEDGIAGTDLYRVTLTAGTLFTAQTSTPADGNGQFVNTLNPRLRLLDSAAVELAADDDSAADGRNAQLSFAVTTTGTYLVEVSSSRAAPTMGEYVLSLTGAKYQLPAFQVTSTTPADGAIQFSAPIAILVNFNDSILSSSLNASDLTIDGVPAIAVNQTSATSASFFVPAGVDGGGLHSVAIAAGAISDLQNTAVEAYTASYTIDRTGPQVLSTSLTPGGTLAPGSVSIAVAFDKPIQVGNIFTSGDFELFGNERGLGYLPTSFLFDPSGAVLTLNYPALPDDSYTLTLIAGFSGGSNFTDIGGNALDGEFSGTFPSGDGNPGGDFVMGFNLDLASEAYPTPLAPVLPLGSQIYDPTLVRTVAFPGDSDSFTLNVDAGQTISVLVTPSTPTLQPTVSLLDPAHVVLGSATSLGSGQKALLQTISATAGGTYTVTVGGVGGSIGLYTVQVFLNAALEVEGNVAGIDNDSQASAQGLDPSVITVGTPQTAAQRGAVLGTIAASASSSANLIVNGSFETGNFSGWTTTMTGSPFIPWQVSGAGTGAGFGMQLTAPQDGVLEAWNGFDGAGPMEYRMTQDVALPAAPSLTLSWKDRLQWDFTVAPGFADSRIYFVEILDPATNAVLAIPYSFSTGPETTNSRGNTGWLSHTADLSAFAGSTVRLQFREFIPQDHTGPAQAEFDAIAISSSAPASPDWYKFTLGAGDVATVGLTALNGSAAGLGLAIYDSLGNPVPASARTADNVNRLATFTAPSDGIYYARVTNTVGSVNYSLLVAENTAFDSEPNGSLATAQDISAVGAALGEVGAGSNLFDMHGTSVPGSLILSGSKITLGINADGSFITAPSGTGIQFLGNEFVAPGSPLATFTIGDAGANFTNAGALGTTQIVVTKEDLSSGAFHGVRIVGTIGGSLQLERVIAFSDGDEFVTIASRLTNLTGTTLNNLAWLENLDPDQGQPITGDFSTFNDVVLGGQLVRADATTPAFPGGLTIGLGSADPRRVVAAEGFDNRDPFQIINFPADPNGAAGDIAIALAFNFGNLAAFQSVTGRLIMPFGRTTSEADGTYSANAASTLGGDDDFYAIDVASTANTLRLETGTPADGSGQFDNLLNPHIELYDPSNVLVATGSTSPDGRNEFIQYQPLSTGVYRVRVVGESGTAGEYVLTKNFSPVVTAPAITIDENGTATLSGFISDPDSLDTHTVAITWAPGDTTTLNLAAGNSSFSASRQYLDDVPTGTPSDVYPIGVMVTDNHGASGSASTSVTVNNVAPTLSNVSVTSGINENDIATLAGTFSDPGTQDTFTLTVDWGDGSLPESFSYPAGSSSFSQTHRYLDDNPSGTASDTYTITGTLSDDDGGSVTLGGADKPSDLIVNGGFETGDLTGWTVFNSGSGNWAINNGTFVPPSLAPVLPPISGNFDVISSQSGPGLHILSNPIVVPQNVASAVLSWQDRIRNFAPVFSDPNQEWRVLVLDASGGLLQEVFSTNPGDPLQQVGPNSRSFDLTSLLQSLEGQTIHVGFEQQDNLSFFNATLDDVSLQVATATATALTVTVNNVDPVIDTLVANSVDENGVVHLTGTYHDAGTQDTHTLTINWGEGVPQTVVVTGGSFDITHQYLDDNPTGTASDVYTIGVTLTDDDTGAVTSSTTTTITNVAPVIDSLSATSVFENGVVHLTGTYHDVGTQDTHTLTIKWGEGSPQTVVVTGGSFDITHQYLDDNPTGTASDVYTIGVTLTDDDTGAANGSTTTTIANVAPVIAAFANSSPCCNGGAVEGQSLSVSGTFTDVGTRDTHTAMVNWGDGVTTSAWITETGGTGSLAASHIYANGGIYTVTTTLRDDDGGTDVKTSTVYVTGAGVVNGTLYVIGTNHDDHVTINAEGNGLYKVHADFLPIGNFKTFSSAGITQIVIVLCDGNDDATISGGISIPALIDGGAGNDHLNGGNGPNIILGGSGDDMLIGGSARDLLIGGLGADRLVGSSEDDILIAGTTSYDANEAALKSLLADWNASSSYASRVAAVQNTSATYHLTTNGPSQTIFSDYAVDQLTGSAGSDMFFANTFADLDDDAFKDIITDLAQTGETALDIDAL